MRHNSFITNREIDLKDYLQLSEADKGRELIGHIPESFIQFLIPDYASDPVVALFLPLLFPDVPEDELAYLTLDEITDIDMSDAYNIVGDYMDQFSDDIMQKFYIDACSYRSDDAGLPSFLFMDYDSMVKNQWLIHFTDDAHSISSNGFTQGVDDHMALGLTTHFDNSSKQHGGYNFAYLLSDFMSYGASSRNHSGGWKYGNECVVFRASGIKVWHHGDEEPQVIFYGNTATDIVPLTMGEYQSGEDEYTDGWCTPEDYYCHEDLEKVVDWVVNNFGQYRKHLVGSSASKLIDKVLEEM